MRKEDGLSQPNFLPDISGDRKCAIGAATREIPYWTLLGLDGQPWGRLCLAFLDEGQAREQMWLQLNRDYPEVLPHGIKRSLRDVEVSPEANVVLVPFDQALVLTLQRITRGPAGAGAGGATGRRLRRRPNHSKRIPPHL